ncbi:MAG TPA: alginate export family protein [Verrucomicrobiae bacterium]|nr:alginate export family protein [Verrucomicrobiae bacterium]
MFLREAVERQQTQTTKEETVKKLWLVVALVAWGGLAINTFADVQNIRLSGDIRIRGYYLNGAAENDANNNFQSDAAFISQRTRVSVEADLEDHVLVVVTLKAEGEWGDNTTTTTDAGAGAMDDTANPINRGWDVGVSEAYVQFNELFYTAATLKLGRQYLHYGRGLIISSTEQEYNYDAARLVLDYYPLTIDLVGAQLVNNQTFGADSLHAGSADLLFVNARYEMSDSALKDIEGYFGWVGQGDSGPITSSRVPPITGAASPLIIGLRGDLNFSDALQTWFEGAYEWGADGTVADKTIGAFLLNVGGRYTLKDVQWVPMLNANYIYASGGGNHGDGAFRPWFDYVDGYNGYLFAPALSNIHIFNLGASIKPYENTTLSLQGYYYLKADHDSFAGSNPNVDFGGPEFANGDPAFTQANSSDLGWEFDWILGYDYSKDVRLQLVYGMFIPEGAYKDSPAVSSVAHEVRAEVDVKF